MSINYEFGLPYTVDYEQLAAFSNQHYLFPCKAFKQEIIQRWIHKIKALDSMSISHFDSVCSRQRFSVRFFTHKDFSRYLLVGLDVTKMLNYIEENKIPSVTLYLKHFLTTDRKTRIFYNSNTVPLSSYSSKPVIYTVHPQTGDSFIIDGNHRIDHYIKIKKDSFSGIFLTPHDLMNANLFLDPYSQMLFRYFWELHYLSYMTKKKPFFFPTWYLKKRFKQISWLYT